MSNPLVTVFAVCYNHERFVVECLERIRTQIYPNIQLIIIDESSTDRSSISSGRARSHYDKCLMDQLEKSIGSQPCSWRWLRAISHYGGIG